MTLGVLDWGIGGLWATGRLRERAPDLDLLYLSDAGSTPYGLMGPESLGARVETAVTWLADAGAHRVLVACHSASTVLDRVRAPVPVQGVIDASAVGRGPGRAWVLGGRRTVRSGIWRRELQARGWTVRQRIAQPLSAKVEAGLAESPETAAILDTLLAHVGATDVVVLACTHYAALAETITARTGARVVDPALAVADALAASNTTGDGRLEAWTTGDPVRMVRSAQRALGWSPNPRPAALE